MPSPWTVRTAAADGADLDLVHAWMNEPDVARRWDQAWPRERWAAELHDQLGGDRSRPCIAELHGRPIAYLEVYWVARDRLAQHLDARQLAAGPDDLGFHIAIGAADTGRGRGRWLIDELARGLFAAHPGSVRLLCEPDRRNGPMLAACAAAAFHRHGEVTLPHKVAAVLIRSR